MIDDTGRYVTQAQLAALGGGGGNSNLEQLLKNEYLTYAAATALSVRPATISGRRITVIGGTISDASPSWMIDGLDVREVTS